MSGGENNFSGPRMATSCGDTEVSKLVSLFSLSHSHRRLVGCGLARKGLVFVLERVPVVSTRGM